MNDERTRNVGLDIAKCICAFFVITVHCKRLPGMAGLILTAMNRTAVPIFFMITGFFYQQTVDQDRVKSQIIKILKMTCITSLFYFIFNGVLALVVGKPLIEYIGNYLTLKTIVKYLLLCASPFQGHLWYLSSILYVLVGIALFERKFSRRKLYWLIPVLLVGHLVLGKYSRLLLGRELPMSIVRNEVFVGLPFFLLGDYLFQKKKEIAMAKQGLLAIVTVVLVITSILERQFLVSRELTVEVEQGISTILLAVTLFIFFWKIVRERVGLCWFALTGRKYSTMIYIIHPTFLSLLSLVLGETIEKPIFLWITPVFIFLISYGFAIIFEKVKTSKLAKSG